MRGKKLLLSGFLHALRLCDYFITKNHVFVLGYHRIRPTHAFDCAFDDGVYGPDVTQFTEHMSWLKRNTSVLSQCEFIRLLKGEISCQGPYSLVTFDDGYADNYEIAYPILKKLEIPAIFFIPSGLIEERTVGWWDVIAYLIKKTEKREILVSGHRLVPGDQQEHTIRKLQQEMKLLPACRTETLLQDLSQACEVELPDSDTQDHELMTWKQIGEVARQNISIGSHTHTHRVLAALDDEMQKEEMLTSKSLLEERVGLPVRSIAFPVGGTQHFNEDTTRLAQECGYDLAFSFGTGHNILGNINPYSVLRLGAPSELCMLSAVCAFPKLMSL